jgi:hypothetical protein
MGLWLEQNEGAKFWLRVMNELKNRGVEDVLIAVVDGLKGFPEAITAVFPQTAVQTCIVHLLRHSLDFVFWKERKPVAAALKDIYRAIDAKAGEAALGVLEESAWSCKYPAIGQSWRRAWTEVIPFYAFPEAITAVFPQARVQTCIVHLLRYSLAFVSWKDRKSVAAVLQDIAHRNPIGGELGHDRPQCQVRLLRDPRQQPVTSAGQTVRPAPAHRQSRRTPRRPETLRPPHDRGDAHAECLRGGAARAAARYRRHHPVPQIL